MCVAIYALCHFQVFEPKGPTQLAVADADTGYMNDSHMWLHE